METELQGSVGGTSLGPRVSAKSVDVDHWRFEVKSKRF